jgi:hypothetical protein
LGGKIIATKNNDNVPHPTSGINDLIFEKKSTEKENSEFDSA